MPRGKAAEDGNTNVATNGYHYTRQAGKWRLTHHIIAEEILGRPVAENETVRFKDGDRSNLNPNNIVVMPKRVRSIQSQIAVIERKIMELEGERNDLLAKLSNGRQTTVRQEQT